MNDTTSDCSKVVLDVAVIGAGVAGLYQLIRLRELGLKVRVFESGTGVGGAWYWNRYPGARFDSESYSYAYSFSRELREEWNWSEHFAGQPEILRYYEHVADRFDLRRDIVFESRVTRCVFGDDCGTWELTFDDGRRQRARFVVAAVGPLTVPTWPAIPGRDTFSGASHHTARWPKYAVDLTGKRVGVVGTAASGVQVVQEAAKIAHQLTVFQRTPNWCIPINNGPITEEEQAALKQDYPAIRQRVLSSFGWFMHTPDPRSIFDVSPEERELFLERRWHERGIGFWQANFRDVTTDPQANALVCDFVARKIRSRVRDPAVAERLIPKDHGFATRRVPLEAGYYEAFNQHNVTLVDLKETPIERVEPTGIRTAQKLHELDVIVYATGFDAVTGSFENIDIRGVQDVTLRSKWREGPVTFLGLLTSGFPNFLMAGGPLAALGNFPPALEYCVDWISELLRYMRDNGLRYVDVREEAELEWSSNARDIGKSLLASQVDSWLTGVNTNVGKMQRKTMQYRGGAPAFRSICEQVREEGYKELLFSSVSTRVV